MLDRFYKKSELEEIISQDYKFGTAYKFPDGLIIDCPSVTQVTTTQMMGGVFNNPALANARIRGTLIHTAIENYLMGWSDDNVTKMISRDFPEALPFWQSGIINYLESIEEIYSIEAFTFSDFTKKARQLNRFDPKKLDLFDPFMVRGSYDIHSKVNGKKRISDWKTSRSRKQKKDIFNYLVQVSTYVLLGKETYDNEVDCLDIVMIYPKMAPDVITIERDEMNYYCNIFLRHLYKHYDQYIGSNIEVGDKYASFHV